VSKGVIWRSRKEEKILVSGEKRKFLGSQKRLILNSSELPWVLNEGKGIG